ncbi:MAG TPA: hypothetical protein VFD12_00050 [Oligella sp.]|nr:hypothetical protein [Oligella sp.]
MSEETKKPVRRTPAKKPVAKKPRSDNTAPSIKPGDKKTGAPFEYDEAVFEQIIEIVATSAESIASICKREGMPDKSTFFRWLYRIPELRDKYMQAKELSALVDEDLMLSIADDGTNDYVEKARLNGEMNVVFDSEHVQRSRLRVDTRKWILERKQPKYYGSKTDVNLGVQEDNPLAQLLADLKPKTFEPKGD